MAKPSLPLSVASVVRRTLAPKPCSPAEHGGAGQLLVPAAMQTAGLLPRHPRALATLARTLGASRTPDMFRQAAEPIARIRLRPSGKDAFPEIRIAVPLHEPCIARPFHRGTFPATAIAAAGSRRKLRRRCKRKFPERGCARALTCFRGQPRGGVGVVRIPLAGGDRLHPQLCRPASSSRQSSLERIPRRAVAGLRQHRPKHPPPLRIGASREQLFLPLPSRSGMGTRPEKYRGSTSRLAISAKCWSGRWESNPRHAAWEAAVLPLNYARDGDQIRGGKAGRQGARSRLTLVRGRGMIPLHCARVDSQT